MLSSSTTDDESTIPVFHDAQIDIICNRLELVIKKYYIHLILAITFQNMVTLILYKYF